MSISSTYPVKGLKGTVVNRLLEGYWNNVNSPIKRILIYPLKSAYDLDLNLLISPAI